MKPIWLHPSQGDAYTAVAGFLNGRIGTCLAGWEQGTILAVVDGPSLVGAVLFHNYDKVHGTIEISAASDSKRWLTRAVLWEMFSFPFLQLGCQAVVARMDAGKPLVRIFTAYGFKQYEIPRLRGRNTVEAVMVLSDDDWLANGFHKEFAHGQERTRPDAAA